MTEDRENNAAQIETLRELWLTESSLSFLAELKPELLARITEEVSAHSQRVQAGQKALYEGMARTSRFIPNFLLAKITAGSSPYVLARITEYLEPKVAAALSKSFEPALLAEISLHLDAALAAKIASFTPLDTLVVVIDTLAQKGLLRRLGEVSDALDEPMLGKLVERIEDPRQLASVAAHMTSANKLRNLAKRIDRKLLSAVIGILQEQGYDEAARSLSG